MLSVTGQSHALVNGDLQIQLPTIALCVGAVFPVGHGAFFSLFRLLGFHNRKTVLHTQLVRCFPKLFQRISIAVVLEAGVAAYGVDYEVRVDVIPVGMGCHYDFKAGNLLRQFQSNLMCHLRGDRIIRPEGLHHVVVHSPVRASILPFRIHKFQQGSLRYAVDPGDQGEPWYATLAGLQQ